MAQRKILIPLDGSEGSENAYQWYLENVKKDTDFLIIGHVVEPPNLPSFSLKSGFNVPAEEWQEIIEKNSKIARKLEEDVTHRARETRIKMEFKVTADKKPGAALVQLAEENGCNMVIMGTRGLGLLKKAFIGSVSDYVLHNCNIPVTIVPAKN